MVRTDIGMSLCPQVKIIGTWTFDLVSMHWISSALGPRNLTSSAMQPGTSGRSPLMNPAPTRRLDRVADRAKKIRHAFTHRPVVVDEVDDWLLFFHWPRPDAVRQILYCSGAAQRRPPPFWPWLHSAAELKPRAARLVRRGPQFAVVGLDDRSADDPFGPSRIRGIGDVSSFTASNPACESLTVTYIVQRALW